MAAPDQQGRLDVGPEWWRTFFHGVALDLWRAAVSPQDTPAQAGFVADLLKVAPGGAVLDVPCGNGRLSLDLAARGLSMTGVDIAGAFIEEARAGAAARGLDARFMAAEMRDLPWPNAFDGAFCWGNSFGYLDDEGNVGFLRAVCRALKPAARFVLGANAVAEVLLPTLREARAFTFGDITLHVRNFYDALRGRLNTEYTFVRDGTADVRRGSQRVYAARELAGLLEGAGLPVEAMYGGVDREPLRLGSPEFIAVCRKAP